MMRLILTFTYTNVGMLAPSYDAYETYEAVQTSYRP